MAEECEQTLMPVDQCAHCKGVTLEDPKPVRIAGSETVARWPGPCAHCGKWFQEGARIVLADLNEGGPLNSEWCLFEHTKEQS